MSSTPSFCLTKNCNTVTRTKSSCDLPLHFLLGDSGGELDLRVNFRFASGNLESVVKWAERTCAETRVFLCQANRIVFCCCLSFFVFIPWDTKTTAKAVRCYRVLFRRCNQGQPNQCKQQNELSCVCVYFPTVLLFCAWSFFEEAE